MNFHGFTYFATVFFFSMRLFSWESHYLLTREALKGMKGMSDEATIGAETLDDFVKAERAGLVNLLRQTEMLSARTIMHYPPLPESLYFTGEERKDMSLTKQFLMSLRVNPDINYPLYVLKGPGMAKKSDMTFSSEELKHAPLSTLAKLENGQALKKVLPGQKLSPLEIMSHSEEPDHGMDFYLWEDSNSWYGALYNFGKQPFGNPLLSFGSQAPFHMGFYHEHALLYFAGAFLKRCYPEYRINQFIALSRFAFATGHPYWGYRFLAFADHYLQDLTQPYHARVAPDASVAKLIGINALGMIGYGEPKRATTQLLSNKHLGLENYQLGSVHAALQNPQRDAPILKALGDQSQDQKFGAYSESYARMVIAKESSDRASMVDNLVKSALPARLNDPQFNMDGHDGGVNLFVEVNKNPNEKTAQLDEILLTLMRDYGAHTRQSFRYVLGQY